MNEFETQNTQAQAHTHMRRHIRRYRVQNKRNAISPKHQEARKTDKTSWRIERPFENLNKKKTFELNNELANMN